MPLNSKHSEASFSPTSTDWLYFRVAEMPRCQDLAILVVTTTDRQTDQLLYPCTCARDNKACLDIIYSTHAFQGVVTAMYPVLPSAMAIKIFDG